MNSEIYDLLIKESEGSTYIATRTRIAIFLLTVTGIRIGELLPLKVGQLKTLLEEGWISIDRLKRGSANHKAFLTNEEKKLVKARNNLSFKSENLVVDWISFNSFQFKLKIKNIEGNRFSGIFKIKIN